MTMEHAFPTWREAYDYAYEQMQSPIYRGWGWASVWKHHSGWIASIA